MWDSPQLRLTFLASPVLLLTPGCGTIDSQWTFWTDTPSDTPGSAVTFFGGFVRDVQWAGLMVGGDRWSNPEIFILAPAWALDVQLSLIADALISPITLIQQFWVLLD